MPKKTATYSELQQELDDVLAAMQREDIGIDEALKKYEAGLSVIAKLQAQLDAAENRVREIKAQFEA